MLNEGFKIKSSIPTQWEFSEKKEATANPSWLCGVRFLGSVFPSDPKSEQC